MDQWQEGVDEVELFNAEEKEALVVTHQGLLQKLRGFASHKRKVFRKWHCYVGFDIFSGPVTRAARKTPAKRSQTSKARLTKVKRLGKVVRGRIRKILTAGILPQALHNAQVVGATDTELDKMVVLLGQMLGVKNVCQHMLPCCACLRGLILYARSQYNWLRTGYIFYGHIQ